MKILGAREKIEDLLNTKVMHLLPDNHAIRVRLSRPKLLTHGDFSCNIAFQLAPILKKSPLDIATDIIEGVSENSILESIEVAGKGFINIFLNPDFRQTLLSEIVKKGENFGQNSDGSGKRVLIEFVSANPTGPLHIGHGRGAAFGATMANFLRASGYDVTCEYYVNDAGRQVDILSVSVWYRYLEIFGGKQDFPKKGYQGEYIKHFAESLKKLHGNRWLRDYSKLENLENLADEEKELDQVILAAKEILGPEYHSLRHISVCAQIKSCEEDLDLFRVKFDTWFHEKRVFEDGTLNTVVSELQKKGLLEDREGAKWFKSRSFGDEKDRVIERSNGEYTYFASDTAYHYDKFQRKFDSIVNIWGSDHHGYIPRVRAALRGLDFDDKALKVILIQFASLYRGGQKVSMSTRSGEFVSLRDLIDEVGVDASRFFYSLRKNDQHLDFDLDLAKEKSNENPVYYVQYAHARCSSIIKKWGGIPHSLVTEETHHTLDLEDELVLIQKMDEFTELIKDIAKDFSVHNMTNYLRELATSLHRYYTSTKVLGVEEKICKSRIMLILSVKQVLKNGLSLLGASAPNKM